MAGKHLSKWTLDRLNELNSAPDSLLNAQWKLPIENQERIDLIKNEFQVSSLTAKVLARRHPESSSDEIHKFLNPSLDDLHDPRLLPDFEAATKEILKARDEKSLIFVHGDYDVDGVTSTAIFGRFLEKIGCKVYTHVPHRVKEGYGIHASAVDRAHEMGAGLFLTCDCGVGAHEQVSRAREFGMSVVVTDHHELSETLPEANAVVNPHREDSRYPFNALCGAGVAFKLCTGITKELGHPVSAFYRAYLDLVTLGTVADMMPLINENRILVKHGLRELSLSKKVGLQELMRQSIGSFSPGDELTATKVSFTLAPRLNAAGRLHDSALSLELLMEQDAGRANEIVQQIERINYERRASQEEAVNQAIFMIENERMMDDPVLVVAHNDWHPGVVGLVAGKLLDKYNRPSFAMTIDGEKAKGSARSTPDYHLADALHRITHLLFSHGGHEMAAGFSMNSANIDAFRAALILDSKDSLKEVKFLKTYRPDISTSLLDVNLKNANCLQKLGPFGMANSEPLVHIFGAKIQEIRLTNNPKHARLKLMQGKTEIVAMAFNLPEIVDSFKDGDYVDLIANLDVDTYRGIESVKLILRDIRATS